MPSASSPSGRAGAGRRCCTRWDLLTVVLAAVLCSATYCFSIWHNGRGAADKVVLGPAPFVAGPTLCGGRDASADAAELDFETHHTAEKAGLSVSSTTATISGRRELRAAVPVGSGVAWAGNSAHATEAGGGKGWTRVNGNKLRFTHAGAVRA